jgi:hypothetical protein
LWGQNGEQLGDFYHIVNNELLDQDGKPYKANNSLKLQMDAAKALVDRGWGRAQETKLAARMAAL